MTYRHTQPGTLILVTCLLIGAFGIALSWRNGQWPPMVLLFIIMLATAVLFVPVQVHPGRVADELPVCIGFGPAGEVDADAVLQQQGVGSLRKAAQPWTAFDLLGHEGAAQLGPAVGGHNRSNWWRTASSTTAAG